MKQKSKKKRSGSHFCVCGLEMDDVAEEQKKEVVGELKKDLEDIEWEVFGPIGERKYVISKRRLFKYLDQTING